MRKIGDAYEPIREKKPVREQRQDLIAKAWALSSQSGPCSSRPRHYAKELIIVDGQAVELNGDGYEQGSSLSELRGQTSLEGGPLVPRSERER